MKKTFLLFSALLLCSVMVFAVSAAEEVYIDYTLNSSKDITVYYVTESGVGTKTYEPSYSANLDSVVDNSWTYDFSNTVMSDLFDQVGNSATAYSNYCSVLFHLNLDNSSYSALDLSEYELTVTWLTKGEANIDPLRFHNHMGIIANNGFPRVAVLKQTNLVDYSSDGTYISFGSDNDYVYCTYTFPASMTQSILSSTATTCFLPMAFDNDTTVSLEMYLTPVDDSEETTAPEETIAPDDDTTDTPEIYEPTGEGTLTDPLIYPYDLYFNIDDTKSVVLSDELTVTDVYNDGTGYKFRDYENYYTVGVQSLMTHEYDTLISMVRNSDSSDAFVDSVCEIFSATFPCSLSVVDGVLDTSRYGFRMEWYFSSPNDWVFKNFKDNIGKINSSFYNLEPFSITVGNVTIPYDYFIFTYLPSSDTFKVTLELDGKDATDRMFMNAFLNHGGEITITYTLDWDIADGVLFGITQSGFYVKYSDDGEQIVPDSTTPSTGGFTQEDLDKARNEGYWEGVSSKVDKNYIFGFVNGIFSSLYNGWNTLGNGISIGGTTLAETVYSCLIIIALIAFAKWVI